MTGAVDLGHIWQPDYLWGLSPWSLDKAPDLLLSTNTPAQPAAKAVRTG